MPSQVSKTLIPSREPLLDSPMISAPTAPRLLIGEESASILDLDSNLDKEPVQKHTLKASTFCNTKRNAASKRTPTDPDAPKTKLDQYMDRLVPTGVGPSPTSATPVQKRKRDDDSGEDSETDDANFHFDDITAPAKRKNEHGKDIGGRPKDEFMGKLTVQCYKRYKSGLKPDVKGYRCVTPGCREFHVQRNKERIAKHIFRDCHRVSKELHDLSPGIKVLSGHCTLEKA